MIITRPVRSDLDFERPRDVSAEADDLLICVSLEAAVPAGTSEGHGHRPSIWSDPIPLSLDAGRCKAGSHASGNSGSIAPQVLHDGSLIGLFRPHSGHLTSIARVLATEFIGGDLWFLRVVIVFGVVNYDRACKNSEPREAGPSPRPILPSRHKALSDRTHRP